MDQNVNPPMPQDNQPTPEMASPEQRQQLLDMIDDIRGKMNETNTAIMSSDNAVEEARLDALKEVFSILQGVGVDLTDPSSVSAFIDKVKSQTGLGKLLENALTALLGDQPQPLSPTDDEAIPESIRGSLQGQ